MTIIDDDRRFAYLHNIVKSFGQRCIVGLLAHDNLNERHLIYGREKMQTDKLVWARAGFCQPSNR